MLKNLDNTDVYDFLKSEISCHPELQNRYDDDLKKYEGNLNFWEELSEQLDCFRVCDECHQPMIEGYCINNGDEHYCSEKCLQKHYTEDEWDKMSKDDESTSYYTIWYEDSIWYNSNNDHK